MKSPAPDYVRQLNPYAIYEREAFIRGKLHRVKLMVSRQHETNADTAERCHYMEHTEYTLADHDQ